MNKSETTLLKYLNQYTSKFRFKISVKSIQVSKNYERRPKILPVQLTTSKERCPQFFQIETHSFNKIKSTPAHNIRKHKPQLRADNVCALFSAF